MAINEQNGRNVFDPSKRIRGKLGNDFIQEAEKKLTKEMSKGLKK